MKKRVFAIFFAMLLSMLFASLAFAAGDMPRLVDGAGLLSEDEQTDLLNKLDEISERQQVDIVVVTVDSLDGKTSMEYADDFYDDYGYGYGDEEDGILFLISMGERDWNISTSGYGITAVTDAGREYMAEAFISDLSGGYYYDAFATFADLCDDYITQARTGMPYDVDNLPEDPFDILGGLVISLVVGFVIALIVTTIMKSGLNSVYSQSRADDYVRKGSMKLTKKSDLFLYKKLERREKPKEDNSNKTSSQRPSGGSVTHTSSSGKTHGGGGGKF